jgi:hypothetical protein
MLLIFPPLNTAMMQRLPSEALTVLNTLLDYVESPVGQRLLQIRVLEMCAGAVRARNRQIQVNAFELLIVSASTFCPLLKCLSSSRFVPAGQ